MWKLEGLHILVLPVIYNLGDFNRHFLDKHIFLTSSSLLSFIKQVDTSLILSIRKSICILYQTSFVRITILSNIHVRINIKKFNQTLHILISFLVHICIECITLYAIRFRSVPLCQQQTSLCSFANII